jgi:hypothetical protein
LIIGLGQKAWDGPNNFEKITINSGINGGGVGEVLWEVRRRYGGQKGHMEGIWRARTPAFGEGQPL